MTRFLRHNSLSLFFLAIFLAALVGQSVAGQRDFNGEQALHGSEPVSYSRYVLSSHFGQAMLENWQSEYLQFALFILATIWFVQRGSAESKKVAEAGLQSDRQQKLGGEAPPAAPRWARAGDWRTGLYSWSLLIVMAVIFLGSWVGQSVTGWTVYNQELEDHGGSPLSWLEYLARPDFWESTLQNWQSEFLAVGSMAVFTIYLRARGSPESKPVGARHDETAASS